MDKQVEFLRLIEGLVTKHPQILMGLMAVSVGIFIYLLIVFVMFIIAFKRGYKISIWPISIDPQNTENNNIQAKVDELFESFKEIKDGLIPDQYAPLKDNLDTVSSELAQVKLLFEKNLGLNEIFKYRIDHIERQTVLPNYKIPDKTRLKTIDDILPSCSNKRVLIKLDLDIPFVDNEGMPSAHIKFTRAAETINDLIKIDGKIMLLVGQGISNIDLFEKKGSEIDLSGHIHRLIKQLPKGITIKLINNASEISTSLNSLGKNELLLLPNLRKISSEDFYYLKNQEHECKTVDILNSNLVTTLHNLFDVYIMDDFRSSIKRLPSNIGLSHNKICAIGRGLERDLSSLNQLITESINIGRKSSSDRVCICGSSRPNDISIIEVLLSHKLFDRVILGPLPSFVLQLAKGDKVNNTIKEKLILLSQQNGFNLQELIKGPAKRIVSNFNAQLVFPDDFIIEANGSNEEIQSDILSGTESFVEGIGSSTIERYTHTINSASLVFHFGMLGHSVEPYCQSTEAIISAYANAPCLSFMAGDHIAGLANKIGVQDKINFIIRGAKTTGFYITNQHLPGLDPYVK